MSLLLIGCGYWGQNWARTLTKLNALGAICELNPEARAALQNQYPELTFYEDVQAALQYPGLQGAVIATPASTHFTVAMQCIEHGTPVMIEKPIATTAEQARLIVEAAHQHQVLVAVGHLLMYHSALMKLKQLIQQGELGEVLTIHCTRAKMGKIRNEENVWLSFAPHDLSILIYLLDEPLEVISVAPFRPLKRAGLEDGMMATFRTPSGKEASIFVSWLYPFKKMETIVVGSKKIAIFDDATTIPEHKLKWMAYDLAEQGTGTQRNIEGLTADALESIAFEYQDPLEAEAQAFLRAIAHPGQVNPNLLPNHGENGKLVVDLLEEVNMMVTDNRQALPDSGHLQYWGNQGGSA